MGGLKDSVNDYDQNPEVAIGFAFDEPTPQALLAVLHRSLLLYAQNLFEIKRVQLYAMQQDFSWQDAAKEYLAMYHSAF